MNRRPGRFFYGWIIVAVMTSISGISMALAGFNFGLFIKPMGDDLGISRATFGWALSLRQVASAGTSPLIGRTIDRHGARLLLIVATLVTCSAMVGLAWVTAGWQVVLLFVAMGLCGMVGPGALAVSVPIAKWFVLKRGRAMAIMSVGAPLGAVIFVPVTQLLISQFGWENAWLILAGLGIVLVLPLALLVRRQPEDMGLLPDGVISEPAANSPAATIQVFETSWTSREATRSTTFWRLVAVFSLVMLGMSSVGLHRIPHFTDQGIDAGLVSLATALDAVFACISTFLVGFLVTRYQSRYLGAIGFVLLGLAVFLTIMAESAAMMFVSMAVFGFGAGGLILMQNFLWADYFGRAHVGSIRGAAMPVMLLFSAAGPPVAGYVQDATGSYNPIWWVGMALMFCGAALLLVTPPPRARSHPLPSRAPEPEPAGSAASG